MAKAKFYDLVDQFEDEVEALEHDNEAAREIEEYLDIHDLVATDEDGNWCYPKERQELYSRYGS